MIIVLVEWPTSPSAVRANRDWMLFEDDEVDMADAQYEYWRTHPNSLVTHLFNTEASNDV